MRAGRNIKERAMSNPKQDTAATSETKRVPAVDFKLEVVVIPVSDVDRAKQFYANLGWRLDADFASGDGWRVIQFTPPGSPSSIIFGKNVTAAAPGSAQGLLSDRLRHRSRAQSIARRRRRRQRTVP